MTSCASLRNSCDEVEESVEVHVVERGLDLVEQIERRRPGAEHREQERQRGERALATGQQRQPPHVLARRARLDLDPVFSRSSGSVRKTRPEPPGNSVVNSAAKFSLTSSNAVSNTVTISRSTARITRRSSRRLSFTSSSCCWRNVVALVQRVVLLERERVDRAHDPQLAVELAGAAGERRALGDLGLRARRGRRAGSQSKSVPERLDRAARAACAFSASSISALLASRGVSAALRSSVARSAAQGVEALARRPRRLRLAPPPLTQPVVDHLDLRQQRGRGAARPPGRRAADRRARTAAVRLRRARSRSRLESRASTPSSRRVNTAHRSARVATRTSRSRRIAATSVARRSSSARRRRARPARLGGERGAASARSRFGSSLRRARAVSAAAASAAAASSAAWVTAGASAAEAPRARTAEPVAVAGDDDDVRVGEHGVERGSPSALHEHDAGEEPLEHRAEAGPARRARTRRAHAPPAGTAVARAHRREVRRRRARARASRRP